MKFGKPSFPIRILMQTLSVVLCLLLVLCLLCTAVVLNLKVLTSSGNLQTLFTALTTDTSSQPSAQAPVASAGYLVNLSSSSPSGDLDIPSDALTDSGLLTGYIYDIIQGTMGEGADVTYDQVQSFIDQSTIMDFASEKTSSYIQDTLSGQSSTTITTDELMGLFEENQALMEAHFNITVDDEMKANLKSQIQKVVEKDDLNGTLRQQINNAMNTPIAGTEMTVHQLLVAIGQLTQAKVIVTMILLCLVLVIGLMALNLYNLPMGLTWSGIGCLSAGLLLSVPLMVLGSADALSQSLPQAAISLIPVVISAISPVHYCIAGLGLVMIVGSIVWRILAPKNK